MFEADLVILSGTILFSVVSFAVAYCFIDVIKQVKK